MQQTASSQQYLNRCGSWRSRILLVFILLIMATQDGRAYEKDTHYYLTYCLARLVGFTPTQAWQIAKGDWSIDKNVTTEPVQHLLPKDEDRAIRARFHAMPLYRSEVIIPRSLPAIGNLSLPFTGQTMDYDAYKAKVDEQAAILWDMGLNSGNIGIYIHYLQDSYAHFGSYASWGHPPVHGSTSDWESANPDIAYKMAFAVVEKLQDFMKIYLGKEACKVNEATVRSLVKALIDANPHPGIDLPFLSFASSGVGALSSQIKSLVNWTEKKPDRDWETAEVPYISIFGNTGPNEEAAIQPLAKIINESIPAFDAYRYTRMGTCTDDGFRLEVNPIEEIVGTWKLSPGKHNPQGACAANDSLDRVYFDKNNDHCETGERAIVFWGKYCWENGKYDKATRTWTFERTPTITELNPNLTEKEKATAIREKLKWHLTLVVQCNDAGDGKMLVETIYQGEIKKTTEENATTSVIIREENSVIKGREGWGVPNNPIKLYWWGEGMRICAFKKPETNNMNNTPDCYECGPRYCVNNIAAANWKANKKARIKRFNPEYTDEVLALVDRLPNCEACINDAPDAVHIYEISNNGDMRSWEWTPHEDQISRNDLRSGKIRAYYIVLAARACSCCGEPEYYKRNDWDSKYEFNKDLAIPHIR